ncbi:phage Gp37/Gp68 family protein [Allocoleopsis sp.]|uniref:phage Gp37/Gp68 family protein n=1 Tax=Allocoleopsis sp. TaxID=3088169 RepID=UPI002FD083E9
MSKIEWTDATYNPIVGCSRISPECDRCYASVAAASPRLQQFPQYQAVAKWDGTVQFVESQWKKPLGWRQPKRIFVCSMSDLFHENVPDEWRDRVFAVAAIAAHHTYQILTKRTQRMVDYFSQPDLGKRWAKIIEEELMSSPCIGHLLDDLEEDFLLDNVWLGTTAGCQNSVRDRVPLLSSLTEQGWTTFVSAEPLLEELHMGFDFPGYKVSQVITGAESGKGARVMDENWVRSLRDQCVAHDVAFFYKQDFIKGKKVSLPELDGQQWAQFPGDIQ